MIDRKPVWKLKSQSDNRWYCKGCYLHCVATSETKPVVCKEENETGIKVETQNNVRP